MKEEMITIPKFVYESEKKMRFFGENPKEIYKKKYNVFIGISISNKKLTKNMASNYLKWAVRNTKDKVAVIIADDLNIVNFEILDKYSKSKSDRKAQKIGKKFEDLFTDALNKLPKKERSIVKIYRWRDVKLNNHYNKILNFLEKEYQNDYEFKSAVSYFIRKYVRKKGRIVHDKEKIDRLATYILGELPTLLEGINIGGTRYGLCIYPTYFASGMSQFVMDIHSEELEIGKKLRKIIKKKAVLVEAWLD